MHAVRSGLAALAGAVHALTAPEQVVPLESRRRVEGLLVGEIERLQRLVAADSAATITRTCTVDLDEVIGHVVMTRRMAGQAVGWRPSGGVHVEASRDAVMEVLNILLANAARHAPGSTATIAVESRGATTTISVTDDGPGVAPELRPTLFERGARGPSSHGQGLGLSMAQELSESLGGSLRHRDAAGQGARFELALPAVATLDGVA